MGFIKEDLRSLSAENIDVIKQKIVKSPILFPRVIYDMKWYNPPLQTMRNPIYQTDVNAVIRFIVDNIFRRTSKEVAKQTFHLALDDNLPSVPVNEFVVWEIIEPLIQNAVEHSGRDDVRIDLTTRYDVTERHAEISISDNGKGIDDALLAPTESGIKRIFARISRRKAFIRTPDTAAISPLRSPGVVIGVWMWRTYPAAVAAFICNLPCEA
jgi:light-regulated signal transduction histidine kinase (bacteriophytochrome)